MLRAYLAARREVEAGLGRCVCSEPGSCAGTGRRSTPTPLAAPPRDTWLEFGFGLRFGFGLGLGFGLG